MLSVLTGPSPVRPSRVITVLDIRNKSVRSVLLLWSHFADMETEAKEVRQLPRSHR